MIAFALASILALKTDVSVGDLSFLDILPYKTVACPLIGGVTIDGKANSVRQFCELNNLDRLNSNPDDLVLLTDTSFLVPKTDYFEDQEKIIASLTSLHRLVSRKSGMAKALQSPNGFLSNEVDPIDRQIVENAFWMSDQNSSEFWNTSGTLRVKVQPRLFFRNTNQKVVAEINLHSNPRQFVEIASIFDASQPESRIPILIKEKINKSAKLPIPTTHVLRINEVLKRVFPIEFGKTILLDNRLADARLYLRTDSGKIAAEKVMNLILESFDLRFSRPHGDWKVTSSSDDVNKEYSRRLQRKKERLAAKIYQNFCASDSDAFDETKYSNRQTAIASLTPDQKGRLLKVISDCPDSFPQSVASWLKNSNMDDLKVSPNLLFSLDYTFKYKQSGLVLSD